MKKLLPIGTRPSGNLLGVHMLTSPADLQDKARKFAAGSYNLLVIAGDPGQGKSTTFRTELEKVVGKDGYCRIESNASAPGAYIALWKHRNKLTLIDDADPLLQQPGGVRLLKQLCDTVQWKRMSYESKQFTKKNPEAPPTFVTESRVAILTNEWHFGDDGTIHTKAVGDRGQSWLYAPTSLSLHRYVASWFWCQDIHDFIGQHLPFLKRLSLRLYVNAWDLLQAGDDWRKWIQGHCYEDGDKEKILIEILEEFPDRRKQTAAAILKYIALTGRSRAQFFRDRDDIDERYKLETITVYPCQGKPPVSQPDPMAEMFLEEDAENDENDD